MSFWKTLLVIIFIGLIIGGILYYIAMPSYPTVVNRYRHRYEQMSTLEEKESLISYTKLTLNDSIDGLNYSELLEWQHKYMVYPASDPHKVIWATKVNLEGRPEEPIEILDSRFLVYVPEDGRDKVMGKCGEFALVYTGLLLANDIDCRIVVDCSRKTDNRTAGDHVWVEVYVWEYREKLRQIVGEWVHVDPTEKRVGDKYMYVRDWNKNINLVYAITTDNIIDVTDTYRG